MMSMQLRARGFTLIELVITLALVAVVATAAMPLVEHSYTRLREAELRMALRSIRAALDEYRAAVDAGQIARAAGDSGYPPSLEALVQPLPLTSAADTSGQGRRVQILLRRLPRDPFHPDPTVPAAQTWKVRAHGSRQDEWAGDGQATDVFDVASRSQAQALDGSRYDQW